MAQKRRRPDRNSQEWKAYPEEVRRNSFTREGTMLAFPTCFPGATTPIVHDESRITALDTTAEGVIYGGAGGRQCHLFAATFQGNGGMVMDIGVPAGATSCAAVACGTTRFAAFVNGPRGGRVTGAPLLWVFEDLIQEWSFQIPPLEDQGECVPGEPVIHAVADNSRQMAVGTTKNHVFTFDLASSKLRVVGEAPGAGRVAVASAGSVVGRDGAGHLWRFNPQSGSFVRRAVALPQGSWTAPLVWARDTRTGLLYTTDDSGKLYSFDESRGFSGPLGQTPLTPSGPMAVTLDGRLFGFCGAEIANMYCYDPARREISNLGVAASVLERRRYGYVFGDAVVGRNGEIVFGEDDDGGHLWLYFPHIQAPAG